MLGIPQGSIKATVLIEHILAAFQMAEILYELRHHSAGLNCGRWDYLFSYIKKFAQQGGLHVPRPRAGDDDGAIHARLRACLHRGHATGAARLPWAAWPPISPVKADAEANDTAIAKVREDKRREATDGHDGTWVAHPGLVPIAKEEFDRCLATSQTRLRAGATM